MASAKSSHSPRSTSAKDCTRPLRGGHSISNRLLRNVVVSKSPSNAKAVMSFSPRWRNCPRVSRVPLSSQPVSSLNSRRAAASGSSLSSYSPLAIDQAPRSRLARTGLQDEQAAPAAPSAILAKAECLRFLSSSLQASARPMIPGRLHEACPSFNRLPSPLPVRLGVPLSEKPALGRLGGE